MQIALIYARAANGVIGANGRMPWYLPQDLLRFKQLTQGCPVVMGRKTWDSLPPRSRPLPGRCNIVVTRQPQWQAKGAQRAASVAQALILAKQSIQGTATNTVWIMGGAQIYAQTLPLATRVELTEIEHHYAGDAYAPELGPQWQEVGRSHHQNADGLSWAFVSLVRNNPPKERGV